MEKIQQRLIIVVQARMSSVRLPDKVLCLAGGRPMLIYLIERLTRVRGDVPVIVATSTTASDDPINVFCHEHGIMCMRGPLDDVAGRFAQVLDRTGAGAFVRISGDSPLLDPAIVDRAIERFMKTKPDLVTNVQQRTFPKGMSVEVVDAAAFQHARQQMDEAEDREHVTRLFYRKPENWRIESIASGRDLGRINLSVDTAEDFATFESIVARMDRPHWSYGLDEILALSGARGEVLA